MVHRFYDYSLMNRLLLMRYKDLTLKLYTAFSVIGAKSSSCNFAVTYGKPKKI